MGTSTRRTDYVLLGLFTVLLVFGLIMLSSASSAIGQQRFGDSYFFVKRQLMYGVIPGLVLFFVFANFSYKKVQKLAFAGYVATVVLLILVFIPGIGTSFSTAAQSWIQIGSVSFQPAEFAKLGLVVFLASAIASKGKDIASFAEGFLPIVLMGAIPILLVVLQPDIGTVSLLFAILGGMLIIGNAQLAHLGGLFGLGVAGIGLMIAIAPYRVARFMTFLHPELDPQGVGYHINQAYLAIGSGGLFGLGFGRSRQKFQYLPEVHADSIFAVAAEELGFLFAVALVLLFLFIALRGFVLAKHAPDQFSRLLVAGIIIWFCAQAFLNIGAMVGIVPLTGVPLPFVSHGGTALMVSMAAVGILVNVSKHVTYSR